MDEPKIRAVRPGGDWKLLVTWRGGAESAVDVGPHVHAYEVLEPLRADERLFEMVSVGEWGWCVHWTDEMEISADTLWRLALEQGAEWLRCWRTERRMTQAQAAAALGVSLRMWRYYEAGRHVLPKTIRLACAGHDAQARAA